MKKRIILSAVSAICMLALAGCGSTKPVTNSTGGGITPPATSSAPSYGANDASALACSGGSSASATLTPELTEGPYFTAQSPERGSLLENGMPGTKLVISGYVYSTECQPVAKAMLDFWQADANGVYDNAGYTLRGHQFTDANGRYELITVVPGIYTGRTEHIHVKVKAPNGKLITTQLFFPGVAQNDSDGIFNANLLMPIQQTSDGQQAQYNFVVPTS